MITFKRNLDEEDHTEVLLKPNSLLVFEEDAFESYHHGIYEREYDTVSKIISIYSSTQKKQ